MKAPRAIPFDLGGTPDADGDPVIAGVDRLREKSA
jgi:hypothetical protein